MVGLLRAAELPRVASTPAAAPARDRTGRRRPRRTGRRLLLLGGGVLAVLLLAAATLAGVVWTRIDRRHLDLPGSGAGVTYLVVGSDSRAFTDSGADRDRFGSAARVPGARADIVLLVREVRGRTSVLEVPRDLVVLSEGQAPTRYALTLQTGLQNLVDVTCSSLGVGVDHVAMVHFDGLRAVVDAVGGVDLTVATPVRDRVTGLLIPAAGRARLDGQQALAFVRSRETERLVAGRWEAVPPTASQRGAQARRLLAAVGARAGLSPLSPVDSTRKLLAFSEAVTVDDSMGPTDLRALSGVLGRVGTAPSVRLPVEFTSGDVPTALARPEALSVLHRFAGPSRVCTSRLPLQPGG